MLLFVITHVSDFNQIKIKGCENYESVLVSSIFTCIIDTGAMLYHPEGHPVTHEIKEITEHKGRSTPHGRMSQLLPSQGIVELTHLCDF